MESLRKVAELLQDGPEMIEEIEEQFFNSLVEKIVAETPQRIRFCLPGGIELTEQLGGIGRWISEVYYMATRSKTGF